MHASWRGISRFVATSDVRLVSRVPVQRRRNRPSWPRHAPSEPSISWPCHGPRGDRRGAAAGARRGELVRKKLAKEILAEAIVDEKAGKCADALEVLRQVIQIQESGEALLHMGECMSKTGKLVEALKTWEHAEDVARTDKDRATQQALLPRLAALRERIPAVALQIPAEAKAVAIKIDGQPVVIARAGVPISLDPGEHSIDAQAEGALRSRPRSRSRKKRARSSRWSCPRSRCRRRPEAGAAACRS